MQLLNYLMTPRNFRPEITQHPTINKFANFQYEIIAKCPYDTHPLTVHVHMTF